MPSAFTIAPRGPFSLAEAARFLDAFAPVDQRADPDAPELVLPRSVVALRADGDGVHGEVVAGEEADDLPARVARVLSLDHDATGWVELGRRDPVLGARQAARPGLRPVLFPSAWEAAAWALLTQRTQRRQALAL